MRVSILDHKYVLVATSGIRVFPKKQQLNGEKNKIRGYQEVQFGKPEGTTFRHFRIPRLHAENFWNFLEKINLVRMSKRSALRLLEICSSLQLERKRCAGSCCFLGTHFFGFLKNSVVIIFRIEKNIICHK